MSFLAKNLQKLGKPITTALPSLEGVKFGALFSPHMIDIDWTLEKGWETPRLVDFGPVSIPLQCGALHYSLQCFEGLKAYTAVDGSIRLFRPEMNAARMNRSMARLAFPNFDEKEWVETLKALVREDKSWVPTKEGYTLYIRPSAIATNTNLRVGPSNKVKLFMIASPVGPYYPEGFKPVKLVIDRHHKRAWPGGSGDNKLGANYGPVILHQIAHEKKGYAQVLWLGPNDVVNEVGAMNFMLVWKNAQGDRELITPPLDGTILPGVTRDSILQLAKGWGSLKVTEANFTAQDMIAGLQSNRVEEMFGCGTAAIVTPIRGLALDGKEYDVPCPLDGTSIASRILKDLSDIQYGRVEHAWSVRI